MEHIRVPEESMHEMAVLSRGAAELEKHRCAAARLEISYYIELPGERKVSPSNQRKFFLLHIPMYEVSDALKARGFPFSLVRC